MHQFSEATDFELNEASHKIAAADERIAKATADFNEAWDGVLEAFAEFDKLRFIAEDGHYLARQKRSRPPKLNEELLKNLVFTTARNQRAANLLWNRITERKVDPRKLEEAVQNGDLDASMVDRCIEVPEPTWARIRQEWTKEDHERAIILGIKKET